ncbi:MAG TPA: amidase [Solirubrobacteraceae bacterium]|nr:amidase [Solirubrobacteraceae bacterium]
MADLLTRPAGELAALVRSGELGARELVQAALERIEALDPELNAFVDVLAEDALATADAIAPGDARPFAGVPIAIKNNRPVEGVRLTYGADFMGDWRPPYDHNVVRRLKGAGFVIVGTTTTPEWGILPWTNTKRFGATRNPWDPDRTSGGSSGGSAAAVAAGMVPLAHGNDGGGSTRIPAACCGLVGLKPQRGRISHAPELGESFLVADGVLTRTVAETAALLDVLAGPELGDTSWAPPPTEPFARAAQREPEALRIAFTLRPPIATPVDAGHADALREAVALLESLGHRVEEADPPWTEGGVLETFTALFAPLVMLQVTQARMIQGREPSSTELEPVSWALWQLVGNLSALDAQLAAVRAQGLARGLARWMAPFDAVLTPSLAEPPLLLDTIDWRTEDPMGLFARSGRFTPFTAIANVTGQPAISLPLFERSGLPVGVQLLGRPAEEGALLALAAQLEAARPWSDRRAPEPQRLSSS